MQKTLNSNKIYKGGSPRIQHEVPKINPKVYGQSDIDEYTSKIQKNYTNHNFSKQDLTYINDYFSLLKLNQDYTGETNNSKLVRNTIMIIETLYTDGKINPNYIQSIINEINNIKDNITPPVKTQSITKVKGITNTINNYDGNITNITDKKISKTPINKSVSQIDINSISTIVKKYYYENVITKDELENLNNYFKVLNGEQITLTVLNSFLLKINTLVENAFTDGRLSQDILLSLIEDIQSITDSTEPKIITKKKIKKQLTSFSPYNKK